jgi:hypothetical protein
VARHPNFAQNSLIYICYNKPAGPDGKPYGTLARFRWEATPSATGRIFIPQVSLAAEAIRGSCSAATAWSI